MRLKLLIGRLLLSLTCLPAASQAEPATTLTGVPSFTNPAAQKAHTNYMTALTAARVKYAADLNQVMKGVLAAANLEEANAINATLQKLATDDLPFTTDPFKTTPANNARLRYEATITDVQRQYGRDLQQALKGALAAANLEESNEINAEIKALVAVLAPVNSSAPLPPNAKTPSKAPGLEIVRYAQHSSQATGQNYVGNVDLKDMGKPLGAPQTVKSLSTWTKAVNENAVVSGFIKIEKAGTYGFRTNSDFDRNELQIDGRVVCKFRDGPNEPQSVRLKAGLLPITCIGYAIRTTETRIQWKPPGQEWSDIPDDLLFH